MGQYSKAVQEHLVVPARARLTIEEERACRLLGRSIPKPVDVRLVIDTGSGRTSLTPDIFRLLDAVSQQRSLRVETSVATGIANLYRVRFEFPEAGISAVPQLLVASLPLPRLLKGYHGVIGRDILRRWDRLLYEGRRGRLTIRDEPRRLLRWLGR